MQYFDGCHSGVHATYLFLMEMSMLPTSVQHGVADGGVSGLWNESRQGLWGFGVGLAFPVHDAQSLTTLAFFQMVQGASYYSLIFEWQNGTKEK